MRKLAAIALLFSSSAFACPELTGSYTCKYQDGQTQNIQIAQTVNNGVTYYQYNGSNIAADNSVSQIPDDDTIKGGTFRAWCDDDVTLKTELIGKYFNNGSEYGDLKMNNDFSLAGTDLKQTSVGSLKNAGGEYPLNGEVTCARNP